MSSRADTAEGRPDRRRSRSAASRAILLEATIASIAERGLEATTLATVSEHAGLSRGLVAFHFAGKEPLIRAALDHANEVYDRSWVHHVHVTPLPAAERLARALAHDLAFAEAFPDYLSFWYALWGAARGKSLYREATLRLDSRYVSELASLIAAAAPPDAPLSPAVATARAEALSAMIYGFWLDVHLGPPRHDAAAARQAAAEALRLHVPGYQGPLPLLRIERR
ncbi:MAG: TetR/AcrR family transcriptional regulator [Hyphomicrobiaceae bacterium]